MLADDYQSWRQPAQLVDRGTRIKLKEAQKAVRRPSTSLSGFTPVVEITFGFDRLKDLVRRTILASFAPSVLAKATPSLQGSRSSPFVARPGSLSARASQRWPPTRSP